ncbi:MAG TPA: hypothetical protein VFY45_25745 [Baekduia sp.]|nr:hypothetical protein [Baekduia sp.]
MPARAGGLAWESYEWALETAERLGVSEVSIVSSTYRSLAVLDWEIGEWEAAQLHVQPHRYQVDGLTVHGVARRGPWHPRGVVLVDCADEQILAEIEGHCPAAIAAVAQWPDDIATWRSAHLPVRIGGGNAPHHRPFRLDLN